MSSKFKQIYGRLNEITFKNYANSKKIKWIFGYQKY